MGYEAAQSINGLYSRQKALDTQEALKDYYRNDSSGGNSSWDTPLPFCGNSFGGFGAMDGIMPPMMMGCSDMSGLGFGAGMGFGGSYGYFGQNPQQIKQYIRQQKEIGNEYKRVESEDLAIERKIGILQRNIQANELDESSTLYHQIQSLVQKRYDLDSSTDMNEIKSRTDDLYYKTTGGRHITEDLKEYGDSSFVNGLKKGTGIGLFVTNSKNADDITAEIEDVPVRTGSKVEKGLGIGLTATAALIALPFALRGGKAGTKGLFTVLEKSWKSLFKAAEKETPELAEAAASVAKTAMPDLATAAPDLAKVATAAPAAAVTVVPEAAKPAQTVVDAVQTEVNELL